MYKKKAFVQNTRLFLVFAGPAVFAFLAVVIIPFLYGFYLTLTDWDGLSNAKSFIGFANYGAVLGDADFLGSLWMTIRYMLVSVLSVNIIGFLLALAVTGHIRGRNFFRAGFFIPNLIGGVVLGYIWQFVFNRAVVGILEAMGVSSMSMLSTTSGAFWALVIVTSWQYSGYVMLIYIAGLMGVSPELLEAARIDGSSYRQTLWKITIPLMQQSFTISIFLTITRCFMVYDLNMSLTAGGPYGSTVLAAMHVYQKAFSNQQFGRGQTEAIILFVLTAIIGTTQALLGKSREVEA